MLLEVENLSSPGKFKDSGVSVRAGEILGLAGGVGAGDGGGAAGVGAGDVGADVGVAVGEGGAGVGVGAGEAGAGAVGRATSR